MKRNTSRCKWDIIHDILKVIQKENGRIKKTKVLNLVYLDSRNFKKYHELLLENGLIRHDDAHYYSITKQGEHMLKDIEKIIKLLDG